MATNPYSYGSLGQRWTVGEPTSKSLLDISRVKNDANRWTLEQLIPDPDTTQTLGFDLSFNSSDQRLLQIYNTDASNYFQIFGGQAATPTSDHLVFSTGTNGTIMAFDGLNHWITFHDTAGVQKMYYRGDGSPGLILEPGVGLIVGGTISGSTGAFSSTLAATGATTIGAGQAVNAKALLTLTSTTSAGYGGEIQFHKNSASTAEIGHESAVLGSGFSSDLFLASDGAIDFATGGTTQRMTILSDGKTGIGTSSPDTLIHAQAADGAVGGAIKYTATGVASGYLSASPDGTVLATDTAGISFRTGVTGNDPTDTGSVVMTILSGGDIGLGTQSPEIRLSVTDTYNGSALTSNDIPAVQIINEQGSYTADNVLGVLGFGKSQGFGSGVRAGMVAHYSGTGSQSSNVGAYLSLRTSADAAGDSTERARIDSSGRLLLNTTSPFASSSAVLHINADGVATGAGSLISECNATSQVYHVHFRNGNGGVGGINTNGTATNYVTSSDYRLKENVVGITDGITRIKSLKPSRFNFLADADRTVDGFVAHEVSDIVPEAISGAKDAVDDEGNPQYQGIDQSKLVPLLTAALQEAITKIETLENKVAALEAA